MKTQNRLRIGESEKVADEEQEGFEEQERNLEASEVQTLNNSIWVFELRRQNIIMYKNYRAAANVTARFYLGK